MDDVHLQHLEFYFGGGTLSTTLKHEQRLVSKWMNGNAFASRHHEIGCKYKLVTNTNIYMSKMDPEMVPGVRPFFRALSGAGLVCRWSSVG